MDKSAEEVCDECDVPENEYDPHSLEKISRNIDIKKRFEDHYRLLLGEDYDKFMNYSLSYIRKLICRWFVLNLKNEKFILSKSNLKRTAD